MVTGPPPDTAPADVSLRVDPECPAELHLSLPGQRSALEPARQAVLQFLSAWSLSPKLLFHIELVLEETLLNAMLHGFTDGAGHGIELRVQVAADAVEMHFTDDGVAFDPTLAPAHKRPVSIAQTVPGGLGLVLVRKLARSVAYRRQDGHNHLVIQVARH